MPGDGWGGGDSSAARLGWGGRERVEGPGGEGELEFDDFRRALVVKVLRVSESCDFSRRSSFNTYPIVQRTFFKGELMSWETRCPSQDSCLIFQKLLVMLQPPLCLLHSFQLKESSEHQFTMS